MTSNRGIGRRLFRIGIDATGVHGQLFGIHIYAEELLKQLLNLPSDYSFVVFCRKGIPSSLAQYASERVRFRCGGFKNRKLTEQAWLSWATLTERLDLFHATYGVPLVCRVPTVQTVHDLFHLRLRENYGLMRKAYLKTAIERGIRRASRLICVSDATANDVHQFLGVERERIDVIHLGVDHAFFRNQITVSNQSLVRERYRLPPRYFLHVGGFRRPKNTARIVKAFAKCKEAVSASNVGLVFAGKRDAEYQNTRRLAEKLSVADDVRFIGYCPKEDLPSLYSGAIALVYPSLIEGFGLPILEAFSVGTRVVTSRRFSMPEVAGDAGASLIDPESVSQLQLAMQAELQRDSSVPDQRCIDRAASFCWRKAAYETIASYSRALSTLVPLLQCAWPVLA